MNELDTIIRPLGYIRSIEISTYHVRAKIDTGKINIRDNIPCLASDVVFNFEMIELQTVIIYYYCALTFKQINQRTNNCFQNNV